MLLLQCYVALVSWSKCSSFVNTTNSNDHPTHEYFLLQQGNKMQLRLLLQLWKWYKILWAQWPELRWKYVLMQVKKLVT